MAKRKKPAKNNKTKILNYITWFLAIVALILTTLIAGYYFGYKNAQKSTKNSTTIDTKEKQALKEEKKVPPKREETSVEKKLEEVLKKSQIEYNTPEHEIGQTEPPKIEPVPREVVVTSKRPRLAIIVDDVSRKGEVKAIKSVGFPITMSFLPPRAARPNSARLAAQEEFYMVHLPMEAKSFSAEEPSTLRVSDSQKKISQRIAKIKEQFPKVRFINNHTGSKFTSDERAMNRLIYALSKNRITFIDSRTIAATKAPQVMKNFGLKYLSRDVFLDNKQDEEYIIGQLKKAVKVAKLHGTAIAICHPHSKTLATLRKAKKYLKDVDLVYVNQLY